MCVWWEGYEGTFSSLDRALHFLVKLNLSIIPVCHNYYKYTLLELPWATLLCYVFKSSFVKMYLSHHTILVYIHVFVCTVCMCVYVLHDQEFILHSSYPKTFQFFGI